MKAESIAQIARKQLKLLKADPYISRVNLKPRHDGSAHIESFPSGGYRYVYTERGHEFKEKITDDPQDILYWIYQDATFEIACKWEVKNRISNQDSRKLIFSKQLELLGTIGEEYANRKEKEIEETLSLYPYTNKSTHPRLRAKLLAFINRISQLLKR